MSTNQKIGLAIAAVVLVNLALYFYFRNRPAVTPIAGSSGGATA